MPAIFKEPTTLTRLNPVGTFDAPRPVRKITTAPRGFEGEGFPVRRTFAGLSFNDIDPFIMMDHMGEVDYEPGEAKGTPWHPHRGFETVTYMMDGIFDHQDNHGGGGRITDGHTQWMTAGSGILHIEKPPIETVNRGGFFQGIQLWVNLSKEFKKLAPSYQDLTPEATKFVTTPDAGAIIRIIAGDIQGNHAETKTNSPIALVHASIMPGAKIDLPWDKNFNALVYVLHGQGKIGPVDHPIQEGQTAVFGPGEYITISANQKQEYRTNNMEVMILGGKPIQEPVFHHGPFVMNTKEELIQAFEDYESGRFGLIPAASI